MRNLNVEDIFPIPTEGLVTGSFKVNDNYNLRVIIKEAKVINIKVPTLNNKNKILSLRNKVLSSPVGIASVKFINLRLYEYEYNGINYIYGTASDFIILEDE